MKINKMRFLIVLLLMLYLEDNHPTTLIAGSEELSIVIKFDARDQVRVCHIVIEGTFDL